MPVFHKTSFNPVNPALTPSVLPTFLSLLDADIRANRNIAAPVEDLARAMLRYADCPLNIDEEIKGEIEI
jgi:hypothetical protein